MPSPLPSSGAARGRPRSQRARQAVLDAARALIEKGGYPAATIEAIAARSGVAKTTIYRWWPHRAALVVDLLLQVAAAEVPPPTGPDPLRALRTELSRVAEAADRLPGELLASLLGEAHQDPEVRSALLNGLFNPRRAATARMIRQAQVAGALRPGVPPLVAVDLLFGPLFYRRFVRHESLTGTFARQVFEHLMAGLEARPAAARRPGRGANREAPRRASGSRRPRAGD